MAKRIISSVEDFLNIKGQVLGQSDWICVTEELIKKFADVTDDHQWIHVDLDRVGNESPFGCIVSHGYLTLSLLPRLLNDILDVKNLDYYINYSIEKMVYHKPVKVNDRLKLVAILKNAKDLGDVCQATIQCSFYTESENEPVLEGSIIFLYYFKVS